MEGPGEAHGKVCIIAVTHVLTKGSQNVSDRLPSSVEVLS